MSEQVLEDSEKRHLNESDSKVDLERDNGVKLVVDPEFVIYKAQPSWKGSDSLKLKTWKSILPVSLCWEDITVTVPTKDGNKDILKKVNGVAPPGKIVAILGPSGAGKTTLLKTLSGQMEFTSGRIYYEGKNKKNKLRLNDIMGFHGNASFLAQEPVMMGSLTVRETLYYSAALKLNDKNVNINERIDQIISYLGLDSARDTKLGNVFYKGVSGGEKRRVSIGVELVTQPAIIFFDEPTSNLDATSAYALMNVAHKLTLLNHTIIMTLHQPSSRIFNDLCKWDDYLVLLERGRTIYNGLCKNSIEFFSNCGFPVPKNTNPPDHFLDVINSSFVESSDNGDKCSDYYKQNFLPKIKNTMKELNKNSAANNRIHLDPNGFFRSLWILLLRNFKNDIRDPSKYIARIILYTMMGLTIGTFYWQIDDREEDIQDRISVLFFVAVFFTFMSIAALPTFLIERSVYVRERMNNHYGPLAYSIASFISSIPWLFITGAICSGIIYGMVNSRQGKTYFLIYLANLFASLVCVESFMLAVSAVAPEFIVGLGAASGLLGLFCLLSGFFILPAHIPDGWKWGYHTISFYRYSFENFMYNEFNNFKGKGAFGLHGDEVLKQYSMGSSDYKFNFCIIIAMTFVYRLLFYLFLKVFNRKLA